VLKEQLSQKIWRSAKSLAIGNHPRKPRRIKELTAHGRPRRQILGDRRGGCSWRIAHAFKDLAEGTALA